MYLVLRRAANDKSTLYEECATPSGVEAEKAAAKIIEDNGKHVVVIAKIIEFGIDISVYLDEGKVKGGGDIANGIE